MSASEKIDALIAGLTDWRGKTLAKVRKAILAVDRNITEEWKWMGSPVWGLDGNIAVGNAHKDKVKLTFAHGASLPDPERVFNNGFNGNVWRSIDLHEGDVLNEKAFKALVRAAIAFNQEKAAARAKKKSTSPKATKPKLNRSNVAR